ncbi:MAG: glycoside hydrolase family 16 protein, partial [Sediminibacterium sp.]|nr:glycoside hydrolase family 16 protein [Sediminibacterium sp.]
KLYFLFLIVICVFSITKGYSQEFKVINGIINITNAAGTPITNKTLRSSKVIINYQPNNTGFVLDSVLLDTTGSGLVSLNIATFPSSLTINNLQTNSRVRIVYKQRVGSVINTERHYFRNGQDSIVRDTTGLLVAPVILTKTLSLPINFESTTTDWAYLITNFEGGNLTTAVNPSASGINTSSRVAKMVKGPGGATYGGAYLTLSNPIKFANNNRINIQVRAPRIGTRLRLKLENLTNTAIFFEKDDTTKTANAWENLSFNLSGIDTINKTYQKIVLIFDNGTIGNGSANFTYYFDNISLSAPTPDIPAAGNLLWSDEFNYTGKPDSTKWIYDIGNNNGWGNGESQYYTNRLENANASNGTLKITAIKEPYSGFNYTSARLLTQGKYDVKYGRIEARLKLPAIGGGWPAFWMLGSNYPQVGWPACGEIDIMEMVGNQLNTIYAALHYPGHSGGAGSVNTTIIPTATTDFHVYTIIWNANNITWYIDGFQFAQYANSASIPYNHNFFILLNVAVGGSFGGTISSSFTTAQMEVDYVRVYDN